MLVTSIIRNDFISIINNIKLTAHVFEAFIGMSYYMAKSDKEILFDLLNTNSYEDFIYDSLHNRCILSPKDLVTSNKVTEYFRRLENDLESLQELSTNSKSSDISSVKSSLNKLQENLQFMRDLNNLFLYVSYPSVY